MTASGAWAETWPALPYDAWQDTLDTLHMWTQIVGKTKLALAPFLNEWWGIGFPVTARGLTTGTIPSGQRVFQVDFDFLDHRLDIRVSDGNTRSLPLRPQAVADFYQAFMATLADLGVRVRINTTPVEVEHPVPFDQDRVHAAYDPESVTRWWRILVQVARQLEAFRTPFVGKSSPVHFYWGSFDLAHTRFSGRPATPPATWPRFMQLAEDQENFSCGFWPGNPTSSGLELGEPAYYAYSFPEPPGFKGATVRPAAAFYDPNFGEFLLPYEAARQSASPAQTVIAFFESTYEAAATLGDWNRVALERPDPLAHRKGERP